MGLRRHTIVGHACLLCCVTLAAIGCGPSGGGGGQTTTAGGATKGATTVAEATKGATTTGESPITTIQVNETEMSLDPADITLNRPGTYVFRTTNTGNVTHAL